MGFLASLFPDVAARGIRHLWRLAAMMGLFFLAVCAVGILRPIRNSLALDGLAATEFYKVYLVSAAVILFVPALNWLADRVPWHRLIPAVALFFALNLLVFRLAYQEGSVAFGLVFYGWYDLFAAALVTQFFIATQLFFNARNAKRAYPVVIAGGSLGAVLGGAITGFFAESVGTPNLLLVAAAVILVFAVGLPLVWAGEDPASEAEKGIRSRERISVGDLKAVAANPQVRLIAATVLLAVLVKQLVDYQYNTVTREVFETRDAVSAFQGKFYAATQWLPIVVLASLRPLLGRWGVGGALLLLPVFMLGATAALAVWWGLWTAVTVKAAETSLRYSAERTGREILYVPVPDAIKLKAKVYIDVAVEKGVGKVLSALLIMGLLRFMDYRQVAFAAVGLSAVWVGVALALRREYVRTLAHSIRRRFASLRGGFASIFDASTLPVVREALIAEDPLQAAFALELLEQAAPGDAGLLVHEVERLLDHPSQEIRARALGVLERIQEVGDLERIRPLLRDPAPSVREGAVRAMVALNREDGEALVRELLDDGDPRVRTATLACMVRGDLAVDGGAELAREHLGHRWEAEGTGDAAVRLELALAAGMAGGTELTRELDTLLEDPDPEVRAAAVRSAGFQRVAGQIPRLVEALRPPETRNAAREALEAWGEEALPTLLDLLRDPAADRAIRRNVPGVLARIPSQTTVQGLLEAILLPETDRVLDLRCLKALNKLRSRHSGLQFHPGLLDRIMMEEVEAARRYHEAREVLTPLTADGGLPLLLHRSLGEAWSERQEAVFRCLGLLHSAESVHGAYLAVVGGRTVARANALEWLERTLGHDPFRRLSPVFPEDGGRPALAGEPGAALAKLREDVDLWIVHCAEYLQARLGADFGSASPPPPPHTEGSMDLVEKVLLLQKVDLLRGIRGAHLALVASIADEVEVDAGTILLPAGEPPPSLYLLLDGTVEIRGGGGERFPAEEGEAFGTWALIDESPSLVEARTTSRARLLRITRLEFRDLLADNAELAAGLLQGLARRIRSLAVS